ncbi:MAG: pirin [Parcubacteria group bacterium]|nr:pirin [Parcubacteria group bacterium]
MKTIRFDADTRGGGDYGWLNTRYSFSFANWIDKNRMGFGALRVLNDDTIAPGKGFDPHSHADMEIITLVMKGAVAHEDSGGGKGVVVAGEVQVMSAGTGVTHAEFNASETDPLELFQIWIMPKTLGGEPRYATRSFEALGSIPGITLLVTPESETEGDDLFIRQDAYLSFITLDASGEQIYELKQEGNAVYVFVIEGTLTTAGETLNARDALGVVETNEIAFAASGHATALIIEVPV